MIAPFKTSASLFKLLAHPARLAILSVLRDGEQCVCHMEAMLKLRQAYISQHLKVLKDAEVVSDRRDGWNMYYRVIQPEIFEIIEGMSTMIGSPGEIAHVHRSTDCPCPKCDVGVSTISAGEAKANQK